MKSKFKIYLLKKGKKLPAQYREYLDRLETSSQLAKRLKKDPSTIRKRRTSGAKGVTKDAYIEIEPKVFLYKKSKIKE